MIPAQGHTLFSKMALLKNARNEMPISLNKSIQAVVSSVLADILTPRSCCNSFHSRSVEQGNNIEKSNDAWHLIQIRRRNKIISLWLFVCCAMVFCIIVLGGFTRLTKSGLSITDWKPITGVVLPSSEEVWIQL